jgi:ketosteroid isomerase-like protein
MTTTTTIPLLDEFLRYVAADVDQELFAPDAAAEFVFPGVRFRVHGPAAIAEARTSSAPNGATVLETSAEPTPSGFVAQVAYRTNEPDGPTRYRTVSVVHVTDGRITELVHYCTGARPADET